MRSVTSFMPLRLRRRAATALVVGCMMHGQASRADDALSGAAVVHALESGAPARAIAVAEALADRGFVSPELAYHRGLAYATRVGTSDEAPGDGGQALAAFLDAEALGASGDLLARVEAGLKAVRSHLARKRSGAGLAAMVEPSPGLRRAMLLALSVRGWLFLAALGALGSAAAALLAWRSDEASRSTKVAVAMLCGALGLGFSLGGTLSDALRSSEGLMVVVAVQAPLFDASTGALTDDEALGEGLPVRVRAGAGALLVLADRTDRAVKRDQLRALQSQR